MSDRPPPPPPILEWDSHAEEPKAYVERVGSWGPLTWRAYVHRGFSCYEGEHGTYAWTEAGAERKARRLLRKLAQRDERLATKRRVQ